MFSRCTEDVNEDYYQIYILTLIFKKETPSLFSNNLHCVKFLQNKAPSHASKPTSIFFEKIRNETKIKTIPFKWISPKFPDVFSMGYCAFGLLKRVIFKRHPKILDRLWNIVKVKWNNNNLDILKQFSFILEIAM